MQYKETSLRDLVADLEGDAAELPLGYALTLATTYAAQLGYSEAAEGGQSPWLRVSGADAEMIADLIAHTDKAGVYHGDRPAPDVPRKYTLQPEMGGFSRLIATGLVGRLTRGERGGLVGGPLCLSHEGRCWVTEGATVGANARITGDALVMEDAAIRGNARVTDGAIISGSARIYGLAVVGGSAHVSDTARLGDTVTVLGCAFVGGSAVIEDDAIVGGDSVLHGAVRVSDDGVLSSRYEVLSLAPTPWGPLTAYPTRDGYTIRVGCQRRTLETLEEALLDNRLPGFPTAAMLPGFPTAAMLPGFIAMARPMVEWWASGAAVRADLVAAAKIARRKAA